MVRPLPSISRDVDEVSVMSSFRDAGAPAGAMPSSMRVSSVLRLRGPRRRPSLLLRRALGVEFEEARQHLVADLVRPAVTPRLLLVAPLLLVDLVVEEELAVRRDVAPAVGVEHRAVHGGVQLAELHDVRVALVGIMEAIVGLGQALVVADHEGGAELVVGLAGGFESARVSQSSGKGKVANNLVGVYRRSSLRELLRVRAQCSWTRL